MRVTFSEKRRWDGEYLEVEIYLESNECAAGAALTASIAQVAGEVPYAGPALTALLTAYAAEIAAKNQGWGVDIDAIVPLFSFGMSSSVHISTHLPVDASAIYEGYLADLRATASGSALPAGSTPDGWIRLGVDLNMGAGGKYIYFELRPMPPRLFGPIVPRARVAGALNLFRLPIAPAAAINAVAIQSGSNSNIPPPAGHTQIPVDLNMGARGQYIYASYAKGARPLTGIAVVAGSARVVPPPAGFAQIGTDLNMGAGGKYIYLCHKP